jgi:hypothetical protein
MLGSSLLVTEPLSCQPENSVGSTASPEAGELPAGRGGFAAGDGGAVAQSAHKTATTVENFLKEFIRKETPCYKLDYWQAKKVST